MTTRITVTTGDGGLVERNAQQQAANRQGAVVKGNANKATAAGIERRRLDRIATGRNPTTGDPLIPPVSAATLTRLGSASTPGIPRLNQQVGASRLSVAEGIDFLPPSVNGPQFKPPNGSPTAVKWWKVNSGRRISTLAMEEEPESTFFANHRRFLSVQNNLMYLDPLLMPGEAASGAVSKSVIGAAVSNVFTVFNSNLREISLSFKIIAPTGLTPLELNNENNASASFSFGVVFCSVSRFLLLQAGTFETQVVIPANEGETYNINVHLTKQDASVRYIVNGNTYSFIDQVSTEAMFESEPVYQSYSLLGSSVLAAARPNVNVDFPPTPTSSGSFGNIKIRFK